VQTGRTDGNIIIDSGTTLTLLEQNFYNDLVASVKEVIGADVILKPENVVVVFDNNLSCLWIAPYKGVSIFGNRAQVDF
ncbi:aspartic proteinase CDR1-like, partial [Trifolium medium]|nr:aspartic proteinase CDR1-like [Trifolium medium]